MKTGIQLISEERNRQVTEEGFSSAHDTGHDDGSMLVAARCYAKFMINACSPVPKAWPWEDSWWKPSDDPVKNWAKAGALIAAEIDRIQRREALKP